MKNINVKIMIRSTEADALKIYDTYFKNLRLFLTIRVILRNFRILTTLYSLLSLATLARSFTDRSSSYIKRESGMIDTKSMMNQNFK